MQVDIGDRARSIIERIEKANRMPRAGVDRPAVESAIGEHYLALGLPKPPVIWVDDAEAGYLATYEIALSAAWSAARSAAWSAARSAAWSAAWSAALSAAWSAAWSAAESAAWSAAESAAPAPIERWIGIWLPFLEAYEAGLWIWFPTAKGVVAVARPVMHLEGERLHCADGPAVWWPNGKSYYFWRGVQVPEQVIVSPQTLGAKQILGERNAEVRRVMIERYGQQSFLQAVGGSPIHRDDCGELYGVPLEGDEGLVMVKVINSTPEPDGTFKPYFLRVHPECRPLLGQDANGRPRFGSPQDLTARNAVASTFGLRGDEYQPEKQT